MINFCLLTDSIIRWIKKIQNLFFNEIINFNFKDLIKKKKKKKKLNLKYLIKKFK